MSKSRTYRMTAEGERPVWASKRELENMGREWAHIAIRNNAQLVPVGNVIHDAAAEAEYKRLTQR